ncbi:hypothetical protein MMC13_002539 [Lambiella insularis]|nr:hypothetical protein [Lambiella insularis]
MSRRPADSDRVKRDREVDRAPRDQYDSFAAERPNREAPRDVRPRRELNEYFVDGDGISRTVLQMDICKYLGPEATCRPGVYNSKPGFYVRAVRAFTPEQLEDLRVSSAEYREETRYHRDRGREEPPYSESQAAHNRNAAFQRGGGDSYYPSPASGQLGAVNSSYAAVSGAGYAPSVSSSYGPAPGYSAPYTAMGPGSVTMPAGYAPGLTSDPRYSNYTYEQQQGTVGYSSQGYPNYQGSSGYETQPPRDLQSGYNIYSPGQDPQRRPQMDDRTPGVYRGDPSQYGAAPANYAPVPYRGAPAPYDAPPNREYVAQPRQPQDPYAGQRRRQ